MQMQVMPVAIAVASALPPNVVDVVHTFRPATPTFTQTWLTIGEEPTDEWNIVFETASRAEVEELQRIWALPYRGDVDFEFRQTD
jgi:hypothetical protein